jgi:asparagine synthase (glutamine-hydrolysing)
MSMAWGLELRVPFLDQPLFECLSRIPASVRLRSGKRLLLDAVPEVPAWVASAPKRGFSFPFVKWFAGEWQPRFSASTRKFGVDADAWYQQWALFVFERWCRDQELA